MPDLSFDERIALQPKRSGVYEVLGNKDISEIDVYEGPLGDLCCFIDDLWGADQTWAADEDIGCHVPLRLLAWEITFGRRLRDLD